MVIEEYKLKQDFRAPKINLMEGEMQSFMSFKTDDIVKGYVDSSTGTQLLIVEDQYALPLTVVKHAAPPIVEKPKTIKEQATEAVKSKKVEIPKEYREQMDKIKNTSAVNTIVQKSRNSVNGIVIGGIVGLVGAMALGKSKMLGVVLGSVAGGLIGYKITGDVKKKSTPPSKETKETKPENGKKD